MAYRAFISYNHDTDDGLAPAIQVGLSHFAKPWYRLRSMKVFRDKASLAANPALWPAIEHALNDSEWFLLMASPRAAQSPWVCREVQWWLDHRSVSRMLLLLTQGEARWEAGAGDFDWNHTNALPPVLRGHFKDEPQWVDLRWAKGIAEPSRQPRFRATLLDIAAPLLGREKDELDGEDIRQHRRTKRTAIAAGLVLSLLLVAVFFFVRISSIRSKESSSRAMAGESSRALGVGDLQRALALSAASFTTAPTVEALDALYTANESAANLQGIAFGHDAAIIGLSFSADNRYVLSADSSATAFRWESATGRPNASPLHASAQQIMPWGFDYSVTGSRLALGTLDGNLSLWNTRTLQPVNVDSAHNKGPVYCIAFSPEGDTVAAGTSTGFVSIWRADDGAFVGSSLKRHQGPTNRIAFSPDGSMLASAGGDGTVVVSSAKSGILSAGHPLRPLASGPIFSLVFSMDSRWLAAAGSDGTVILWNVQTPTLPGQIVNLFHGAVASLGFGPDHWLVAGTNDGTVLFLNPQGVNSGPRVTQVHTGPVTALAFSRDNARMASSGADGKVVLWSLRTKTPVGPALLGHHGPVSRIAFSSDNKLIVSGGLDGRVVIWRNGVSDITGQVLSESSGSAVFSPSTGNLLLGQSNGGLSTWNVNSQLSTVPTKGVIESSAFNNTGSTLLTGYRDGSVAWWNTATSPAESRETRRTPTGLAFAPALSFNVCSSLWAVAGQTSENGQTIGVIDFYNKSGDAVSRLSKIHEYGVLGVAVSPDCRFLASSGMDGKVVLWTMKSESWQPAVIKSYKGMVHGVAFTADGAHIAWAEDGGTIGLYEVSSRRVTEISRDDFERAYSVAFSPDGRFLAGGGRAPGTAETEGVVLIWDVSSGKRLGLPKHLPNDGPATVAFSPNGRLLAAAVSGGPAVVWQVDPVLLRDRACRLAQPNLTTAEWGRLLPGRPFPTVCN